MSRVITLTEAAFVIFMTIAISYFVSQPNFILSFDAKARSTDGIERVAPVRSPIATYRDESPPGSDQARSEAPFRDEARGSGPPTIV